MRTSGSPRSRVEVTEASSYIGRTSVRVSATLGGMMSAMCTGRKWTWILMVIWTLGGCGEDTGIVTPEPDTTAQEVGDATAPKDTAEPDLVQLDTAPKDTAVDVDAPVAPGCDPGEGCFEERCSSGEDCLSGICTMHLGEQVCSKTCDATCPEGWACTLVGTGGDAQYVCLSNFSHLCLPCSDPGVCSGGTPGACIKYPDGLSFCGGNCDLETPCPSGYSCQEVETTEGAKGYQCVATAGVCNCSDLAIETLLSTPCEVSNEADFSRPSSQLKLSDCLYSRNISPSSAPASASSTILSTAVRFRPERRNRNSSAVLASAMLDP